MPRRRNAKTHIRTYTHDSLCGLFTGWVTYIPFAVELLDCSSACGSHSLVWGRDEVKQNVRALDTLFSFFVFPTLPTTFQSTRAYGMYKRMTSVCRGTSRPPLAPVGHSTGVQVSGAPAPAGARRGDDTACTLRVAREEKATPYLQSKYYYTRIRSSLRHEDPSPSGRRTSPRAWR